MESAEQDTIIETILTLMEQVECFVNKNGIEKKAYVMAGGYGKKAHEPYINFIRYLKNFDFTA